MEIEQRKISFDTTKETMELQKKNTLGEEYSPEEILPEELQQKAREFIEYVLKTVYQIVLTEEDREELQKVKTKGDIKIFLGCAVAKYTNEELTEMLQKLDILGNIQGPMDITESNIQEFLTFDRNDVLLEQLREGMKQIRTQVQSNMMKSYVEARNQRDENGELDTFVSISEYQKVQNSAIQYMNTNSKISHIMHAGENLSQVQNTMKDQAIGSRYIYEWVKMILCNDMGYSPDSVDRFLEAMMSHTRHQLDEGITSKRQLYHRNFIREGIQTHGHLLEKDPSWKRGERIYQSKIVEEVDRIEREQIEKWKGKSKLADEFLLGMEKDVALRNQKMKDRGKQRAAQYRKSREVYQTTRSRRPKLLPRDLAQQTTAETGVEQKIPVSHTTRKLTQYIKKS